MTDKRRQHGEGTVEERSKGRWRFKSPDGAGGRFVSASTYPDRDAAIAGLAHFRQQILDGSLVPVKGMTLGDYYERFYLPRLEAAVKRGAKAKGTLGFYRSHWPRLAPLANRPLASLDVPTVTRWGNALASKIESPATYLATLRAILQDAVSVDFILDANVARDVRLVKTAPTKREADKAPTPEEAAALLGCEAIPKPDRLIIAFALGAGLRPGEWRTLELVDVHLDDEVPYVYVQYGSEDRGQTKTGKKRRVPLLDLARNALGAWLAQLPEFAPSNPLGLVFPTSTGKTRTEAVFGRRRPREGEGKGNVHRWQDFLDAAGIGKPLTPHGLRHGCATGLLTGWLGSKLDPWAVQVLVGHDRLATTERYLHHREDDLLDVVRGRGNRSPNSPAQKLEALESVLFRRESRASGEMVPRDGIEPPEIERGRISMAPQAESEGAGTVRGPLWSRLYERIVAGDWPDEAEARQIAAEARQIREEADPVLRAARRVESTSAWQSGLFDLVRLMLDDKEDHTPGVTRA